MAAMGGHNEIIDVLINDYGVPPDAKVNWSIFLLNLFVM